jgi:hypothetical protein
MGKFQKGREKTGGTKAWEPTQEQRNAARIHYGLMASDELVGRRLGVSAWQVRKHLKAEKAEGVEDANNTLYGAIWGEAIIKKNTACLIFLSKNRLGMSDRQETRHSGDMPVARADLNLKITYVYPTDPRAFPPPPPERLKLPGPAQCQPEPGK